MTRDGDSLAINLNVKLPLHAAAAAEIWALHFYALR